MDKISNYKKLCLQWQTQFLAMDQQRLMRILPELKPSGAYLALTHFGRRYGIHRETGEIAALDDDDPISHDVQLNIYTLLAYCRDGARQTGRWVPFRDVRGAAPFAPAFQAHILQPLAATFSGHCQQLQQAALKLGGVTLPQSDAGCLLYAFDCIPMQFLFWDGDDEFPAQANILYDDSVTDYIHVESTVTLASEGLRRLATAANLPLQGSPFVQA